MDIQKTYTGLEQPTKVTKRYGRASMYYIPYDITDNGGTYTYKYVPLGPDNYTYGGLVDAIIGAKYSLSEVIAIVINYVGDSGNEIYKTEFEELQEWRQFAKIEARKYFNM